jgi:general secretion pathway protein K
MAVSPEQVIAESDAGGATAQLPPPEYDNAPAQNTDPGDMADAGNGAPVSGGSAAAMLPEELAAARFALLLNALEIDNSILQPILDWLDADSDTRFPNGAEDAYYLKLDAPYRSANRPLSDISELLLVRGVTQEIYRVLAPYLCALPTHTDVNINTAPLPVLMSLSPHIDRRAAELIARAREVQAFQSIEDFLDLPIIAFSGIAVEGMSVHSQYFESTTAVTSPVGVMHSRTLLSRAADGTVAALNRRSGFFDD